MGDRVYVLRKSFLSGIARFIILLCALGAGFCHRYLVLMRTSRCRMMKIRHLLLLDGNDWGVWVGCDATTGRLVLIPDQ